MESKQDKPAETSAGWGAKKAEVTPEDIDDAYRKNMVNQMAYALQNNLSLRQPGAPLGQQEKYYLTREFGLYRDHAFWDHQPVRQIWKRSFVPEKDGPYVKSRDVTKVPKEATELPANFEWC